MSTANISPGSIEPAIDEVLGFLGIDGMGAAIETDILKGKRTTVPTLHRWTVALCLGEHFEWNRRFSDGVGAAKVDDAKLRVILETLNGEIKCPTHDALNILAYTTLECLQYPRLSQITLDNDQDARELFLAFVFLLGKQKWFHRTDRGCTEYLEFRKSLVSAIHDGIDVLNITQELGKLGTENISKYLAQRSDNIQQGGDHRDLISSSETTVSGKSMAPNHVPPKKASSSSIKGVTMVHFLKVSDSNRCNGGSAGTTRKPQQGNVDATGPSSTSAKTPQAVATGNTRVSGLSKQKSLIKKTTVVDLTSKDSNDHVVNKDKVNTDISDIVIGLESMVRGVISDFEAKAQLLCRSKNAETFDSELLRIIMGQNDQQVLFNNLMDNNELTDVGVPDLNISNTRATKLSIGRSKVAEHKDDILDKDSPTNEINRLLDDIKHLSYTIIQTQSRLKRLSQDVEQGDAERLKHFSRLSENLKVYDRTVNTKNGEAGGDHKSFINDRYSMPSPAEWLLISQKESFERHLSLLKMIAKSLDNEAKRSSMFEAAVNILDHLKPEQSNKRSGSTRVSTPAEGIRLITIPHEVRETVNGIKSFMVDGIPSENFRDDQREGTPPVVQGATDFLRQVNSSFANYRASTLASEKGKKGSFLNYLTATLKERSSEGKVKMGIYSDTRETVDNMLHLFEDSAKHDPRIQFACLPKWIQETDGANDLYKVNGTISAKGNDAQSSESVERQEARDFEVLQELVNHGGTFVHDSQTPDSGIGGDKSGKGNILDFKHYFNLARDEYITKESNDDEKMEPTFVKFGKVLKQHNCDISQSHMTNLDKATGVFEMIRQYLAPITLLE